MTIALALPPPLQIAAAPMSPLFCLSTCNNVTTILAPEAPKGCPMDTAPPLILTLEGSRFNNLLLTNPTTENASFSSKASTSSI